MPVAEQARTSVALALANPIGHRTTQQKDDFACNGGQQCTGVATPSHPTIGVDLGRRLGFHFSAVRDPKS